jgi:hypothetical protein
MIMNCARHLLDTKFVPLYTYLNQKGSFSCRKLLFDEFVSDMKACTKCGRWHEDAEAKLGQNLSCTDVKQYWARIREQHMQQTGHRAQISTDESGQWICMKCNCKLF